MIESISMFILAYNEEKTIEQVVRDCCEQGSKIAKKFEVIVVLYEGSKDRTREIVERLRKEVANLRVVIQKKGDKGYGEGLRLGITHSKHKYIFYTDGDAQFNLADINRLLPYVKEYDVVTGFRQHRKDQIMRRVAAWVYNLLLRIVFRTKVRDIDCAFKIYNSSIFKDITITCKTGMADAEIIIKAMRKGYKIKEVGVRHYPRTEGKAVFQNRLGLIKPRVVFELLKDMRKVYREIKK